MLRRLGRLVVLVSALSLALAATAHAAAPIVLGSSQAGGHLTVAWSLPPGAASALVEVSTGAGTSPDGSFYSGAMQDDESLRAADTSWTSSAAFDPGTYYVHVAGVDTACYVAGTCPVPEYSGVAKIVVPIPSAALAVEPARGGAITSSQIGLACPGTCAATWAVGSAITLTATPQRGWRFVRWVGGPCPGRTRPTCAVTVAAGSAPGHASFARLPARRRR